MPINAHHADTVMPPADTVEQYYAPQYLDGFPATEAADTVLGDINTLPVMELPDTGKAEPFARSPLHDTASMALLLTGLMAVTLCYHTGYKYIENFFHYMFSTRRRGNLFEDHTVNETSILAALIANTCIVEGFLIYLTVQLLQPALAASLQAPDSTSSSGWSIRCWATPSATKSAHGCGLTASRHPRPSWDCCCSRSSCCSCSIPLMANCSSGRRHYYIW